MDRDTTVQSGKYIELGMKVMAETALINISRATGADNEAIRDDAIQSLRSVSLVESTNITLILTSGVVSFRSNLHELIRSEIVHKASSEGLAELRREIESKEDNGDSLETGYADPDQLWKRFERLKKSYNVPVDNAMIEKHQYNKMFEDRVAKMMDSTDYVPGNTQEDEAADEDSDEDLQATQVTVSTKDPFTMKEMVDPVVNKLCGHSYERKSILDMIKRNGNTKCPVSGCPNRGLVLEEHLSTNYQLRKQIREMKRTR